MRKYELNHGKFKMCCLVWAIRQSYAIMRHFPFISLFAMAIKRVTSGAVSDNLLANKSNNFNNHSTPPQKLTGFV